MGRIARLGAVALLVAAFVAAGAGTALAQPPSGAPAYLRLAHLSPDTPNVDVYLASVADPAQNAVIPGVGYGAISDYRPVPAGPYTVSMRPSGAPADQPPVIATTVEAQAGAAYTVAGVGRNAELGLRVLDDQLALPPPGMVRVRVVNASPSAPAVDVALAGGPQVAGGVPFAGQTDYVTAPVGTWTLEVGAAGRPAGQLPVTFDASTVYTVLLVDRDGRLATELHRDSVGAAAVPSGAVDTGLGGLAGSGTGLWWWAGASAVFVLLALVSGTRRRNSVVHPRVKAG